jgi:hypothetical protein
VRAGNTQLDRIAVAIPDGDAGVRDDVGDRVHHTPRDLPGRSGSSWLGRCGCVLRVEPAFDRGRELGVLAGERESLLVGLALELLGELQRLGDPAQPAADVEGASRADRAPLALGRVELGHCLVAQLAERGARSHEGMHSPAVARVGREMVARSLARRARRRLLVDGRRVRVRGAGS